MPSRKSAPPPPSSAAPNDFFQTALLFMFGFAAAAILVYLWGEHSLHGRWTLLSRLAALALLGVGLVAWRLRIKLVHLAGEEDEWYVLSSWNGRTIGFLRAGFNRITPIQKTEAWTRVLPLFIKEDVNAQNKLLDSFDVHARVKFEVYPDMVAGAEARWLRDHYPKGIEDMVRGMLRDVVAAELRKVDSYSQVMNREGAAEASLREAINRKFAFLAEKGVYLDEAVTFVDIMVSAALLMQRSKTRAELSTLQIIRDVAHDMGISTDELLIQRALEQLPNSRSRQNIGEIAAVLQMIRQEASYKAALPPHSVVDVDLEGDAEDIEDDWDEDDEDYAQTPSSYVEGQFEPIEPDPHDPDDEGDGSKSIFSPF